MRVSRESFRRIDAQCARVFGRYPHKRGGLVPRGAAHLRKETPISCSSLPCVYLYIRIGGDVAKIRWVGKTQTGRRFAIHLEILPDGGGLEANIEWEGQERLPEMGDQIEAEMALKKKIEEMLADPNYQGILVKSATPVPLTGDPESRIVKPSGSFS